MCVLIFSTTFIWNISDFKRKWARYCHKRENVFVLSTRYSCRILKKLEFSRQIFEENSNIKFHHICLVAAEFYADRRTDWHEINSRFPQFRESI
jgi:hypothetical protein